MQIISKFHDYYDIVMGFSYSSDDICYVRTPKKMGEKSRSLWPELKIFPHYDSFYGIDFQPFNIGFCGKIYHGVRLIDLYKPISYWYSGSLLLEHLKKAYKRKFTKDAEAEFIGDKTSRRYYRKVKPCIKAFLDNQTLDKKFSDRCIEKNISIKGKDDMLYKNSYYSSISR